MRSSKVTKITLAFTVLLNALSWLLPSKATDFYADHIFPVVTLPLAALTSLVPFSYGEFLILFGLSWLAVLAVFLLAAAAAKITRRQMPRHFRGFLRATGELLTGIFLVMTLNCFVLYHCTPLEKSLPGYGKEVTVEDLTAFRNALVSQCNTMAAELPRDESGNIRMDFDIHEEARRAEKNLGFFSKRLSGFQVRPKGLLFSGFISQQHMMGYYFPFSMEANYNTVMEKLNRPSTICHELAHTHGYILEDDANLIGFLACVNSGNPVMEYSGYLGILNYVNNDFYRTVGKKAYWEYPVISDDVWHDAVFLTDESWEAVEERSPLDTQTVKKAADTYVDTTLKVNGVKAGKASYSHVIALLLAYYDGRVPGEEN